MSIGLFTFYKNIWPLVCLPSTKIYGHWVDYLLQKYMAIGLITFEQKYMAIGLIT